MSRVVGALSSLLGLVACDRGQSSSTSPDAPTEPGQHAGAVEVPTLPDTLVGTFVPAGANDQGRVLIVSEDMLATLACADCGVPTYVRLDQIACLSADTCMVAGEGCRGQLRREGDRLSVTLQGDGDAAQTCASYAGEFVPGEMTGTTGDVIASSDAPGGRVVIGDIRSPRDIDLDASRRVVDARVPELDACYQAALVNTPDLHGVLVIEVVHGARGVQKAPANVHQSSFEHPGVGECLSDALAELDYPVATDGLPAPVYYSLELVPR